MRSRRRPAGLLPSDFMMGVGWRPVDAPTLPRRPMECGVQGHPLSAAGSPRRRAQQQRGGRCASHDHMHQVDGRPSTAAKLEASSLSYPHSPQRGLRKP